MTADNDTRITELEAGLNRITETVAKNHLEVLAEIDRLTKAFETLQQGNTPFQESSHATVINSTKQSLSCTIAFHGISIGISGLAAGAGALLLSEDGSLFYGFREGLGNLTQKEAEYRALILGLKQAIMKGFKNITVKGESKFVTNQFGEPWQTADGNLRKLCLEAMKLRNNFDSFSIHYIPSEHNKGASDIANYAIHLNVGQVEEERLDD